MLDPLFLDLSHSDEDHALVFTDDDSGKGYPSSEHSAHTIVHKDIFEKMLERIGTGKYQLAIYLVTGIMVACDGAEMTG